jgi:hypothetical protein
VSALARIRDGAASGSSKCTNRSAGHSVTEVKLAYSTAASWSAIEPVMLAELKENQARLGAVEAGVPPLPWRSTALCPSPQHSALALHYRPDERDRDRPLAKMQSTPGRRSRAKMVQLFARISSSVIETADMLVNEVLLRNPHDQGTDARRAPAHQTRGAATCGGRAFRARTAPASQLPRRFLQFQNYRALTHRSRTDGGPKTTMSVALARNLLIELWRLVTTGIIPRASRCMQADKPFRPQRDKFRHPPAFNLGPGCRT